MRLTHASGIGASADLQQALVEIKEERGIRGIKIQIEAESLVVKARLVAKGGDAEDFADAMKLLEDDVPCFVLFRLSGKAPPEEWLLVSWVPEYAKVRLKMVYASTRDALKKEIGYSNVVSELHAAEKDEATWDAYEKDALVTEAERLSVMSVSERARLEESNTHLDTGIEKTTYIHSVQFPLSQDAQAALGALNDGEHDFVIVCVDAKTETVQLVSTHKGGFGEFKGVLEGQHAQEPRYSFFAQPPPDGGEGRTVAFVFSCPESSPVRTKMMYSTAKAAVLQAAAGLGVAVDVKLEIRDMSDLSHDETVPVPGRTPSGNFDPRAAGGMGMGGPSGGLAAVLQGGLQKPKGPGGRRGLTKVPVLPPN